MGKYSMDNPDPERHRPGVFDWRWDGCGTSVEVGYGKQLTVVTLGDWLRIEEALGGRGRQLLARVRAGSEGLRRCVGCGSGDVVRYRAPAGGGSAGYCAQCWSLETGEDLSAVVDSGWSTGA